MSGANDSGAKAFPEGGRPVGGSAPSEQQQQASPVGEVDGFVLVGDARDEPGSSPSRPARTRGDKASQPGAVRSPEATQPPSVSQAKPSSGAASSASAKATASGQGGSGEMVSTEPNNSKKEFGLLANAPRDVGEGILDGVKSIAFGVGAGVAGLVAMPVMGASQEGMPGLMKGLAAGVVGAVVLPVAGVFKGVGEIVGGVINTPETVASTVAGKEWDPMQKKWVHYSLNEEAQRVLAQEWQDEEEAARKKKQQQGRIGAGGSSGVRETGLYDLLGVAPDADAEAIKKAYYRTARRVHPDKNPNDAEAHQKFQELSHAYQVLSNDQLRAAYDRDGAEAVSSSEQGGLASIDPALFFNMLFGSEKFEPYTGKLKLAQVASAVGEMVKSPDGVKGQDVASHFEGGDKARRQQNTREVKCAMHLVTLLEPFVSGGTEGEGRFSSWAEAEARELAKGAFGPTMLVTVGWSYENQALEFLGGYSFLGVEALGARLSRTGHTIIKQADMGVATIGAIKAAQDLSATMQDQQNDTNNSKKGEAGGKSGAAAAGGGGGALGGSSPEAMAKAQAVMEQSIPVFVKAAWKMSALEIQETIGHVCSKVLRDKSVPEAQRKRRAQALLLLGRVFRSTGEAEMAKQGNGGEVDAKKQVEEALHKTVAASLGQEL